MGQLQLLESLIRLHNENEMDTFEAKTDNLHRHVKVSRQVGGRDLKLLIITKKTGQFIFWIIAIIFYAERATDTIEIWIVLVFQWMT